MYLNPMPFQDPMKFEPPSDYQYTKVQLEVDEAKLEFERRQFELQVQEISRLASAPPTHRRFLDVGCGPGMAVRVAVDSGWDATGLDVDYRMIEVGRRTYDVDLHCNDLRGCAFRDGQFHFVRIKSVLHLIANPLDTVREIARIMAPGAVLLITMPNEQGLSNSIKKLSGKNYKNKFGTLALPHHLYAFNPKALGTMIRRAGLEPLRVGTASPRHRVYATVDQLKKTRMDWVRNLMWEFSAVVNRGSLLLAYAQKKQE
jgi:2-polyprenyl-6-hydroxyphenyl methylase/3-demethylubiquinone-9 3-methyltransferase